jgi:hypothetical protein
VLAILRSERWTSSCRRLRAQPVADACRELRLESSPRGRHTRGRTLALLSLTLPGALLALAAPQAAQAAAGMPAASASPIEVVDAAPPDPNGPSWAANPLADLRITLFADTLARRDDLGVFDDEGEHLDDRVFLRSLAARFEAPIGELGRGVVLARWSELPDGEFESEVDEAFVELDRLDVPWEALEERLALRIGRFRAPFGRSNRWHVHELPQITRPLPVREILGEDGLVQTGLAAEVDVPTGTESVELLVTLELARDYPLDESFTPFFNFDLRLWASERDRFDLGYTRDTSKEEHDFGRQSALRGLDLAYSRRPVRAGDAGGFLIGGESLQSDVESAAGGSDVPSGYYVWSQLELLPRWFASARFDRSDAITDDSLETRTLGGYLGWSAHPRLRVSAGYEHTTSDDAAVDGLDTLLAELTFSMGSAAPTPSWVRPAAR